MATDDPIRFDAVKRRRILQALGSTGLVGLAGCTGDVEDTTTTPDTGGEEGDSTPSSDPKTGGKLNFAQVKSPLEFDPVVLNDVPSAEVAQLIFEGLYEWDEGTGHVPTLAADLPEISDDGQRFTVEIEPDATFSNGDPVTATDVKHSFEALVDEQTDNANEVVMIDTVTAVDEKTVQFDLKFPFAPFMTTLHREIVPKSVREADRDAFNKEEPIGSGPFVFVDWTEGEFVRVARNEDYWGDQVPYLDEIEFQPVEEATTRVTTLSNGERDVIKEIPPEMWDVVEGLDNVRVDATPGINYFYLAFNCNDGPTADPQVREAVDYLFDMDQAVENFVEPTGVRMYSPVPRAIAESWDFPLDEWEQIPHDRDLDQARSLLDDAGVPGDYSWRIIVPPDDKRENIGITVGNALQEIGYSAEVQRLDWGAFLEQYVSGDQDDYNMYTLGWSGSPDPDSFTYYLLGRTDDTLGVTNGTFWGNNSDAGEETAEMFVQAREESEMEARREIYIEAITTTLQERPHLPSYNLRNTYGVQNYVEDFTSHSVDQHHISSSHNNVWVNQ